MKRYPTYKCSEIEYIADVPEHWEIWKLKYLVKDKLKYGANEAAELDDRSLPRYIRITDFDNKGKLKDDTFKSLPYEIAKEYLLKNGDILFARSGATVGKTLLFDKYIGLACFAGYLIKASCNGQKMNYKFLDYYTSSSSYQNWKDMIFIQSTIQNIGADKYNVMLVPKPTLPEQQKIVRFLDYNTGPIDSFITNRQKQIELLKEQKTGIINKAVTNGINPNAKMIPSGLDWLPEIPEQTSVMTLKHLVKTKITDGPHLTPTSVENGIPFISAEAIQDYSINFNSKWGDISVEDHLLFSQKCKPQNGDIFIVKSGATTGKAAYVNTDIEFSIWSPLALVRADGKKILSIYLFYFVISKSFQEQVQVSWSFGTQQNIGMGVIQNLKIITPTLQQQQEIVNFIKEETSTIDNLISKYQKQIDLMQEYRKTLISQTVTGKIDVREWQPKTKDKV